MVAGPRDQWLAEDVQVLGQGGEQRRGAGHAVEALDPEGDLDQDLGRLVGVVADGPAPVGRLAPRRPVQAGVDPDPCRPLLAREAVGGLEAHVAEEHVDLEPLLDRLALEERGLERVPVGGDELGEDVVQHGGSEATVLRDPPPASLVRRPLGPVRVDRAHRHRLRPPGRGVGGPVVDAARHRRRACGGGRHRDRARRPRHQGRPAGRLPRRHRGPHVGGHRGHRVVHLRRADPSRTMPTGGPPVPTSPPACPTTATRSGAGPRRPPVRVRAAGGGARGVPNDGAQPRHQADGAGRRPLRGGAGASCSDGPTAPTG